MYLSIVLNIEKWAEISSSELDIISKSFDYQISSIWVYQNDRPEKKFNLYSKI